MTNPIRLSDHRVTVSAQDTSDESTTDIANDTTGATGSTETVGLFLSDDTTGGDPRPITEDNAVAETTDREQDRDTADTADTTEAGEDSALAEGAEDLEAATDGQLGDEAESASVVGTTRRQVFNTAQAQNTLPMADRPLNLSADDKPIAWLCGVHGGAGVSTLAEMLAPFRDCGGVIPAHDDPNTTILVAATHKSGLRAAHDAVLQFTSGNSGPAELLGVILVDHVPGKLPKSLAGDVQRIREATPSHNVWHINYIPAWRSARPTELPSWSPQPPGSPEKTDTDKLTRAQRKDRSDPLRYVPPALAGDAQDMFDRAFTLYHRLNPTT